MSAYKNIEGEKVSVIMPACDEEDRIVSSLEETIKTFYAFGCDFQIVVVDDGSSDKTAQRVREFIEKDQSGRLLWSSC